MYYRDQALAPCPRAGSSSTTDSVISGVLVSRGVGPIGGVYPGLIVKSRGRLLQVLDHDARTRWYSVQPSGSVSV